MFVTVRHLKPVDSTVVLFWTAFVGLIISLIATAAVDHFVWPTNPREIGYVIGVGLLTLISQEALTRSLKLESAGLISLLRTSDIVWSFVWQIALFGIIPHYFSIIGACLVVLCVTFVSLREAADKLPPQSRLRRAVKALDRLSCTTCCHGDGGCFGCLHRRKTHPLDDGEAAQERKSLPISGRA